MTDRQAKTLSLAKLKARPRLVGTLKFESMVDMCLAFGIECIDTNYRYLRRRK